MRNQAPFVLVSVLALVVSASSSGAVLAQESKNVSQPIASVLREPLPPEKLTCVETTEEITIEGPVFSYTVGKASGAITSLRVLRNGDPVIESLGPAEIAVDRRGLASSATPGKFAVVSRGEDKVVLRSEGVLKEADGQAAPLPYSAQTTLDSLD
jgi:hypothetical protein